MSEETTKQCPFCAETIQAAAVVCRYCGRELDKLTPAADRQYIERSIAEFTKAGWQVVSQTETSVQLRKPKGWDGALLMTIVLVPLLLGFLAWTGFFWLIPIGLLIAIVQHLGKKEQVRFVSADDAKVFVERAEHPHVTKDANGYYHCSACNKFIRGDATTCKHCGVAFATNLMA